MGVEGNGWSQYEKLVLSQLEDLRTGQKEAKEELQKLSTGLALANQTLTRTDDHEERISKLETDAVTEESLKSERRWIYGTAVGIVASIIIPTVAVLIQPGFIR